MNLDLTDEQLWRLLDAVAAIYVVDKMLAKDVWDLENIIQALYTECCALDKKHIFDNVFEEIRKKI